MAMKTVWFWKGPKLNNNWFTVANFATDEYEKPSTVVTEICPTDEKALSFTQLDNSGNLVVKTNDEQFDGSPELWYIIEETKMPVEMIGIHGMCCGSFPEGTVIKIKDLEQFGINKDNRVGFVRWFKKDSRLQQVYTAEQWRRKRVSTKLIAIADIVIVSGELGPYLNGGDITTEDGEKLREAWSHSSRVIPQTGSVEQNH